jgi:gliding motility-associated-like protein
MKLLRPSVLIPSQVCRFALTIILTLQSLGVFATLTMTCPADISITLAPGECDRFLTVPKPVFDSDSPLTFVSNTFTNFDDPSGVYHQGRTLIEWIAFNANGEWATCSMSVTLLPADPALIVCRDTMVTVGTPVQPVMACPGFALRFDGVDDQVIDDRDLGVSNIFTYEFYVRPTEPDELDVEGLGSWVAGVSGQHYALYPGFGAAAYGWGHSMIGVSVGTNGVSVYEHSVGFLAPMLVYATPLSTTAFTHVAVVVDNNGTTNHFMLYLNGVMVRETFYAVWLTSHPNLGFSYGATGGGIGGGTYGYFKGDIDDVQVWNYARTSAEIAASVGQRLSGSEAGLVAYMGFNEGAGGIASGPQDEGWLIAMDFAAAWIPAPAYIVSNNVTGGIPFVTSTPGIYNVTWSIKDHAETCTQTVEVYKPLTMTCPADIVVTASPGVCGTFITVPIPATSDGQGSEKIFNTFTQTVDASGQYPVGTTLVIWKSLLRGVTTTCCATRVTVLDKEGPAVLTCAASIVQELSGCGNPVNVPSPGVSDNCSNGSALSFDGVDDVVATDWDLQTTGKFTYEFYVRPSRAIGLYPSFANQNYVIYPGDGAAVYGAGHSIIGVSVGKNAIRVIENSNGILRELLEYETNFPVDEWTHISVLIDQSVPVAVCKLYKNGTYIHSDNYPGSPVLTLHASLGYRPQQAGGGIGGGTLGHFAGAVDELRVWNTLRTIAEMSADRRRGLTGIESHLTAYYSFNEGAGNVTHGSAGSAVLQNMNTTTAWVQPDAITDYTLLNSFNLSSSASDMYPVGVTHVNWILTDKFGNISTCANDVQVNNLSTMDLICSHDTIDNEPDKCSAPYKVPPPQVVASPCAGYAVHFDGDDDYISPDKDLGVTNTFTYEFWVKPKVANVFQAWGIFPGIQYAVYPGLPEIYQLPSVPFGLTGHSSVGISVGTNGIAIYEHSFEYLPLMLQWNSPAPITGWTHVAVSYKNNIVTLYVNGIQQASHGRFVDGRTVHANFGIPGGGGGLGGGLYGHYEGDLDEIRLWDYARTPEQIQNDMNAEVAGNEPGLKGYYHFNEGPGKSAATSRFGAAELINMDIDADWIQPDPIPDYVLTSSLSGTAVGLQDYEVGEHTVTWTLTDKYGVMQTCSSTITVVDAQPPVVQCPPPSLFYVPDGSTEKTIDVAKVIAQDNCGIKSIVNSLNGTDNASGTYPVGDTDVEFTITDIHGNVTLCAGVQVTVAPTKLKIPTGISPNGDGVNDAWVLHGLEYFDRANVKIYNRNGDLVYQGDDYDNENIVFTGEGNRGLYKGSRLLPNGTYFYHLTTVPDNELKAFTGFLEISK